MYTKSISRDVLKANIQSELSSKYGFTNTSNSSVVTHIVDAVSGAMADNINSVNSALGNLHTYFAKGDMLTVNAYEFGVIRNNYGYVFIKDSDHVVSIVMDDGSEFPDYLDGVVVVSGGTELPLQDGTVIQFANDVYLTPGQLKKDVTVSITTVSETDIKSGTSISQLQRQI